jgi:hypothetical protein
MRGKGAIFRLIAYFKAAIGSIFNHSSARNLKEHVQSDGRRRDQQGSMDNFAEVHLKPEVLASFPRADLNPAVGARRRTGRGCRHRCRLRPA